MSEAPPRARLPSRRHRLPRCRVCGLHIPLCVCPLMPRVELPVEFILVQHAVEIDRPTNTGRMVMGMLPNSRLITYAARGVPLDESPLREPDTRYLLMFPRSGARVLSPEAVEPAPFRRTALVMLDGSWAQASHMARRITSLWPMTCVRLPEGPPGAWAIRRPLKPEQLCTLEAAIRAVAVLGRTDEAARMQEILALIESRMLHMRGVLPRPKSLEEIRAAREAPAS